MTTLINGAMYSHVYIDSIKRNVCTIQLIGCQMLKFTNNKNNASNKNCITTLQVTACKQRNTQIRLHSISTVLTGRHGAADAVATGDDGGTIVFCIVFMTNWRISRLCATIWGYTGKMEMPSTAFLQCLLMIKWISFVLVTIKQSWEFFLLK